MRDGEKRAFLQMEKERERESSFYRSCDIKMLCMFISGIVGQVLIRKTVACPWRVNNVLPQFRPESESASRSGDRRGYARIRRNGDF